MNMEQRLFDAIGRLTVAMVEITRAVRDHERRLQSLEESRSIQAARIREFGPRISDLEDELYG